MLAGRQAVWRWPTETPERARSLGIRELKELASVGLPEASQRAPAIGTTASEPAASTRSAWTTATLDGRLREQRKLGILALKILQLPVRAEQQHAMILPIGGERDLPGEKRHLTIRIANPPRD